MAKKRKPSRKGKNFKTLFAQLGSPVSAPLPRLLGDDGSELRAAKAKAFENTMSRLARRFGLNASDPIDRQIGAFLYLEELGVPSTQVVHPMPKKSPGRPKNPVKQSFAVLDAVATTYAGLPKKKQSIKQAIKVLADKTRKGPFSAYTEQGLETYYYERLATFRMKRGYAHGSPQHLAAKNADPKTLPKLPYFAGIFRGAK